MLLVVNGSITLSLFLLIVLKEQQLEFVRIQDALELQTLLRS